MADDKSTFGPPDSTRINVKEDYEFRYWTRTLNCTPNQLRDAVKAAGASVEAVRKHLKNM